MSMMKEPTTPIVDARTPAGAAPPPPTRRRSGTAVLALAGVVAVVVGGGLLLAPDAMHASSDIDLRGDANLSSETRAAAAAVLAMGALMLSGAVVARLRFAAMVAAAVLYLAYGAGRLVAWALDGRPHPTLVVAAVVELLIGAAAARSLVTMVRVGGDRS
jgi:hypothetical protein